MAELVVFMFVFCGLDSWKRLDDYYDFEHRHEVTCKLSVAGTAIPTLTVTYPIGGPTAITNKASSM
jgi:hypothetical protein